MKRYLIFTGSDFYPSGGWSDFKKSTDSLSFAKGYVDGIVFDDCTGWGHVVDIYTCKIVYKRNGSTPLEEAE